MDRSFLITSALVVMGSSWCADNLDCQRVPMDHSIYVTRHYNPSANPADDLVVATQIAQESGKRILMEVGGNWCIDCVLLDKFIRESPAILQKLRESFVILKVNYGPTNRNEEFLEQYPRIEWFPHINVLETDGTLLHSYDTRGLHEGRSLNEARILAFLEEWASNGNR